MCGPIEYVLMRGNYTVGILIAAPGLRRAEVLAEFPGEPSMGLAIYVRFRAALTRRYQDMALGRPGK
jgi:hypothetical protein